MDGPKTALWTPMRKTPAIASPRLPERSAASTKSITAISKTLTPIGTVLLLNRSASCPPDMEKRMNGTEKRMPRSGTMLLRWEAVVAAASPMNVTSPLSALC